MVMTYDYDYDYDFNGAILDLQSGRKASFGKGFGVKVKKVANQAKA